MVHESGRVKRRPYDARGRRDHARVRRERIIDVARRRFLADGYAATTIAAIAEEARVSMDTIYKSVGRKPRLAKAVFDDGIAGHGPVPTGVRATEVSTHEGDPRRRLRGFGSFVAEVTPRVAPLMLLVKAALDSDGDPELAAVWAEMNDERLASMTIHAQRLFDDGHLREGVGVDEARDVMWTFNAPEVYDLLVQRRGWDVERFGRWVGEMYIAALLPQRQRRTRRSSTAT
jgi:AcrR family transcriptional regulator